MHARKPRWGEVGFLCLFGGRPVALRNGDRNGSADEKSLPFGVLFLVFFFTIRPLTPCCHLEISSDVKRMVKRGRLPIASFANVVPSRCSYPFERTHCKLRLLLTFVKNVLFMLRCCFLPLLLLSVLLLCLLVSFPHFLFACCAIHLCVSI